jgi:hypothetical protein
MSDPRQFLSALALTLAGACATFAQGSTPDPLATQLKHCVSLTVASTRLACYDALAGFSASNQVAAPPPAGSSNAATARVAGSSGVAASSGATATAGATASPGAAATAAPPAASNGVTASGTPPAPSNGVAASGAPPAPSDTEFGVHNGALEAKLITPQRPKHMLAVVSAVSNRPRGELVVTLDNGQVWVQLEPTNYPLKAGDHVEIDVGALGSYILWSPSNRRATKVTRIS